MGERFLLSLDFFKQRFENLELVNGENSQKLLTNYKLLLFTSFCPTLACTTPVTASWIVIFIIILSPICNAVVDES
jgi:hypothetical protein